MKTAGNTVTETDPAGADRADGVAISELISLTISDVTLGAAANIRCVGKGRKQRVTPMTTLTADTLTAWLTERGGTPTDPLFPTRTGRTSAATRSSTASAATAPSPSRRVRR